MYFWKINRLKEDLIKGPLSESESFKYLIAITIVYGLTMVMVLFLENNFWDIYSAIVTGIISIVGVIYIYKCNNGREGTHFLQRYLSLGWVVGIRWMVLLVLPATIVYFIALGIYSEVPSSTTLLDLLFLNLLYLPFFWLFGKHIKDVANRKL